MDYGVMCRDLLPNERFIQDAPPDESQWKVGKITGVAHREVVEDSDLQARCQRQSNKIRTNEAGTAGHENIQSATSFAIESRRECRLRAAALTILLSLCFYLVRNGDSWLPGVGAISAANASIVGGQSLKGKTAFG